MPIAGLPDGAYLHECAKLHADLTSLLSKRPQDLTAVEKAVARVRSKSALRYEDIRVIVESPHFSAGRQYWSWPDREEIETGLHHQKLDLWHLPKNERAIIKQLRVVLKTTDAVSVILRFVGPRDYGILSAPVEHVLGIQPSSSSIDRYIAYLKDLRSIREKYEFETAALVDQALWTLQVGVQTGILEGKDHLRKAHAQDKFIRSIRVKNLADALFEGISRVELAESLSQHRSSLAGELAALEFERAVLEYSGVKPHEELTLKQIITEHAPSNLRDYWQRCRKLRNDAVHRRRELSHRDVGLLIDQTRSVVSLTEQRRRPVSSLRRKTPGPA